MDKYFYTMEIAEKQLEYVVNRMRLIRLEKKVSQLALSEKADLSASFIASLETGKKQPSLLTVIKIANALGVSPKTFFSDAFLPDPAGFTKKQIKDEIVSLLDIL